jgi:hypothetical protein
MPRNSRPEADRQRNSGGALGGEFQDGRVALLEGGQVPWLVVALDGARRTAHRAHRRTHRDREPGAPPRRERGGARPRDEPARRSQPRRPRARERRDGRLVRARGRRPHTRPRARGHASHDADNHEERGYECLWAPPVVTKAIWGVRCPGIYTHTALEQRLGASLYLDVISANCRDLDRADELIAAPDAVIYRTLEVARLDQAVIDAPAWTGTRYDSSQYGK